MQVDAVGQQVVELAELLVHVVLARFERVVRAQHVAQAEPEEVHVAVSALLVEDGVALAANFRISRLRFSLSRLRFAWVSVWN